MLQKIENRYATALAGHRAAILFNLNLKNLMVSGTKISGVAEILGDKVTFLAEFALRKALIRIDVAQHM